MSPDNELYKRIANIEGEITFISKVIERLDTVLPLIITNEVNLKTVKERQDACPVGELKTRVSGLEKDATYFKWILGTCGGFILYIQKQAIWMWIQKTFS